MTPCDTRLALDRALLKLSKATHRDDQRLLAAFVNLYRNNLLNHKG